MIPPKENKKYPINDFKESLQKNYQWTENTSLKDKNTQTKENKQTTKKQCMQIISMKQTKILKLKNTMTEDLIDM